MKLLAACAAIGVVTALLSPAAMASTVVMDFSNNLGLGVSTGGTSQTIDQNGVQMATLSGTYVIPHPVTGPTNLNFTNSPMAIQFDLVSGLKFDFLELDLKGASAAATITSNLGGSFVFDSSNIDAHFSPPSWENFSRSVCRR